MKRILYFLLFSVVISSALVSCQFIESQHNHKYSKTWTTTEKEHWREASCEHSDLIVNKGEHTFDDGVTTKSPTEEEEGIFTITCTVCKYEIITPIARLPHTHKFNTDEYAFNERVHWKNATCEHTNVTSTPESHAMLGNICIVCDYMADSQGLAYTKLSDGTYEVKGRGDNLDSCLVIPATYNGAPVTSIGEDAFNTESDLETKLVIPASIKTIKDRAFYQSYNLEEVIFKGESSLVSIGEEAFFECYDDLLTSFTIPKSVTHIGTSAFEGCASIESFTVEEGNTAYKSVDGNIYTIDGKTFIQYAPASKNTEFTVPAEVTTLSVGAFAWCSHLEKVSFSIDSEITTMPRNIFYYSTSIQEITLPAGITFIDENAFSYCQKLHTMNIPANLTHIGNFGFNYCKLLPEFELPETLKYIGDSGFAYCEQFTKFDVPNGVLHIGNEAFSGCIAATEIKIPASVTSFGDKLFYGSQKLQAVTIDPENTKLQSIDGNVYSKDGKTFIYYCVGKPETSFELESGVTTIAASAFYACKNLESIVLPETVKTIGASAFMMNDNLKTVHLPDTITSIGDEAFYRCTSLTEITIPSGLKTLSKGLLYQCTSLTSLVIPENITEIKPQALAALKLTSLEFEITEGWVYHYVTDQGKSTKEIDPEELKNSDTAIALINKCNVNATDTLKRS